MTYEKISSTIGYNNMLNNKVKECYLIHPSIHLPPLVQFKVSGKSIPAAIGQETQYALDRSPVRFRANIERQPFVLTFIPMGN